MQPIDYTQKDPFYPFGSVEEMFPFTPSEEPQEDFFFQDSDVPMPAEAAPVQNFTPTLAESPEVLPYFKMQLNCLLFQKMGFHKVKVEVEKQIVQLEAAKNKGPIEVDVELNAIIARIQVLIDCVKSFREKEKDNSSLETVNLWNNPLPYLDQLMKTVDGLKSKANDAVLFCNNVEQQEIMISPLPQIVLNTAKQHPPLQQDLQGEVRDIKVLQVEVEQMKVYNEALFAIRSLLQKRLRLFYHCASLVNFLPILQNVKTAESQISLEMNQAAYERKFVAEVGEDFVARIGLIGGRPNGSIKQLDFYMGQGNLFKTHISSLVKRIEEIIQKFESRSS